MPRNIRVLFDHLINFVSRVAFHRRASLGNDRGGALFSGDCRHLPKKLARFGEFGDFFTPLDHRQPPTNQLEKIDILVALANNHITVFVVFLVRINHIGRQALFVGNGTAQRLVDTGDPFTDFLQGGFAQRGHPLLDGNLPQLIFRYFGANRLGDLIGYFHQLKKTDPPLIPEVVAGGTADRAIDHQILDLIFVKPGLDQLFGAIFLGLLAVAAEPSAKALGENHGHRGGEHIGWDANIHQSADGRRTVVGMEGGKDQVAGHRRLDGDFRSFDVADLADHDDVWILAQKGLQGGSKGHPHLLVDVDLVDPLEVELHRILSGENFDILTVHRVQSGIEGNCLARPGRSGNQQQPLGSLETSPQHRKGLLGKAQLGQVDIQRGLIENPQDHRLTIEGRQRGDPKINRSIAPHPHLDPAILGDPTLGNVQAGKNFQPGDQGVLDGQRQVHAFKKGTVLAVTHLHGSFIGFDMDIGNPVLNRFDQNPVYQLDDRGIGGGKLLPHVIAAVGFNFKIVSGLGNDRTEIVNLGDI